MTDEPRTRKPMSERYVWHKGEVTITPPSSPTPAAPSAPYGATQRDWHDGRE
jgi:hypothetical protein